VSVVPLRLCAKGLRVAFLIELTHCLVCQPVVGHGTYFAAVPRGEGQLVPLQVVRGWAEEVDPLGGRFYLLPVGERVFQSFEHCRVGHLSSTI
jgi:hypothetical protein